MSFYYLQTRYDFTYCNSALLILVVDVAMFGIFCTFYYSYIAEVIYGCLGALLFSLVREGTRSSKVHRFSNEDTFKIQQQRVSALIQGV